MGLPADFPQFSTGSPPRRQNFPFPCTMISHVALNATNHLVYRKLTQTCKYFYSKNPVVIVKRIHINPKKLSIDGHYVETKALKTLPFKFWLNEDALVNCRDSKDSENFHILISKIYRVNLIRLEIRSEKLEYSDLVFLSTKGTFFKISILQCKIVHDSPIDIGDVIKLFLGAKELYFDCTTTLLFTSKTIRKLMGIPIFPNLKELILYNVPEIFDFENFVKLMMSKMIYKTPTSSFNRINSTFQIKGQ